MLKPWAIVDSWRGAGLFKKHKITRYAGTGRLLRAGAVAVVTDKGDVTLECKHVILASGSISAPLAGVEVDRDRIGTSTEALSWPAVPKHLVVIGARSGWSWGRCGRGWVRR
jgi:dihydrolipoamide dehydrogenase